MAIPLVADKNPENGYLYNNEFSFTKSAWYLDANNTGPITFVSQGSLSGYFSGLFSTGSAFANLTASEITPYISVAESALNPSYLIDFGGYLSNGPGGGQTYTYTRQSEYKGVTLETFDSLSFTGLVPSTGQSGRYVFASTGVNYNSGLLTTTIPFSSVIPASQDNVLLNLSPYRGVAFASLIGKEDPQSIVDYPMLLTGNASIVGKNAYAILHESYPTLLYKNLDRIDYSGEYTFNSGTMVSGIFVLENFVYKKGGGTLSRDTTSEFKGIDLPNSYIKDSLDVYRNLSPISEITLTTTNLAIGERSELLTLDTNQNFDWNGNNFIALKPTSNINYPPFYSNNPPVLGLSLNEENFLYNQEYTIAPTKQLNLAPPGQGGSQYLNTNITFLNYPRSTLNSPSHLPPYNFSQWFMAYKDSGPWDTEAYFTIPFVPDLKSNQGVFEPAFFCFSAYVKRHTTDLTYRAQFLQISTSDGLDVEDEYQNFDLHENRTANLTASITSCGVGTKNAYFTERNITPISITPLSNEWFRISFAFRVSVNKKVAFINIRFVDSCAANRTGTLALTNALHFGDILLEKLPTQELDPNFTIKPSTFDLSKFHTTQQSMTVNAAFEFFLAKLYGVDGSFQKNFTSYQWNQLMPIPTDTKTRIKQFFDAKLAAGSTLKTQFFTKQRSDRNFMKMLVGSTGISFDISDGVTIFGASDTMDYYISDPTYGSGISEIINIVKTYNPFYSSEYYIDTNSTEANKIIYTLPDQPYGYSVEKIPDLELSTILFSGVLKNTKKSYIPGGYGRHYFGSGFFFETEGFYDIRNKALLEENSNTNVFPNARERLNEKPFYTLDVDKLSSGILTRIVAPTGTPRTYTVAINKTGYVESSYFIETKEKGLSMTGMYFNATGRISDVWNFRILDTLDDGSPELVPSSPSTLIESGHTRFDMGVSDNTYKSLFLKTMYTPKPFQIIDAQDEGVLTLTVTSGATTLTTVSKIIP